MLRVIAVIKHRNQTVGYRLLDEVSGAFADFNIQNAYKHLNHYGCKHATLSNGELVCLDGSVNRLPVLDARTLQVIDNDVVIVLAKLVKNGETVGYRVTDFSGQVVDLTEPQLIEYESTGYYNAKVVSKDGKKIISAIKGNFPIISLDSNNVEIHPSIAEQMTCVKLDDRQKDYAIKLSAILREGALITPNVKMRKFTYYSIGYFMGYTDCIFEVLLQDRENRKFRIDSQMEEGSWSLRDYQVYSYVFDTSTNSWNFFKGLASSNSYNKNIGRISQVYNMIMELANYIEEVFY